MSHVTALTLFATLWLWDYTFLETDDLGLFFGLSLSFALFFDAAFLLLLLPFCPIAGCDL
jgi:hypothetical protein